MAIMQVPITKGKASVEIDTDKLPEAVYAEALLQGLKVLANRGMTKVTVANLGSADEVAKEAMVIAAKNAEAILEGNIKFTGKAKANKVSGVVNTEAMRIARNRVKDAMKAAGMKISYVKASEITAAAKELINEDASIVVEAQANIDARAQTPKLPEGFSITALVKEDPKLKAAAEAKKAAEKAGTQSAKQAGLVKGRKPKAKPEATA